MEEVAPPKKKTSKNVLVVLMVLMVLAVLFLGVVTMFIGGGTRHLFGTPANAFEAEPRALRNQESREQNELTPKHIKPSGQRASD